MLLRRFEQSELHEAIRWAIVGNMALHVCGRLRPTRLAVFNQSGLWAHLFCQDREGLIVSARHFGVQQVIIHHEGSVRQHVDLCGRPLELAMRMAEMVAEQENNDNAKH